MRMLGSKKLRYVQLGDKKTILPIPGLLFISEFYCIQTMISHCTVLGWMVRATDCLCLHDVDPT